MLFATGSGPWGGACFGCTHELDFGNGRAVLHRRDGRLAKSLEALSPPCSPTASEPGWAPRS
jgi:hypothetical protein